MSDVAVYVVPFCWGLDLLTPLAKRVEGLVDTKFSDQDRLRRPVEHRVEEVHPGHLDAASRGGGAPQRSLEPPFRSAGPFLGLGLGHWGIIGVGFEELLIHCHVHGSVCFG